MKKIICVISLRNLGDSVIQSSYIKSIAILEPSITWIIWTRPESKFFYESISNSIVITSTFIFKKDFSIQKILGLLKSAWFIRSQAPMMTIDFFGDWRELFLAKILNAKMHLSPYWAKNHVYRKLIRMPLFRFNQEFHVQTKKLNVYEIYEDYSHFILSKISPQLGIGDINLGLKPSTHQVSGDAMVIGIHPYASQTCRMWPMNCWTSLVLLLVSEGFHVKLIASPDERSQLEKDFSSILSQVSVISVDISKLSDEINQIDLLIGLDSFSVHLANSLGVRNIMINGANNPDIYRAPLSSVIFCDGGCSKFPCYNKPSCVGTKEEFSCIKSIKVVDVFKRVIELFSKGRRLSH